MAEPISKKSGAYFRKSRARKNELERVELSKIKPLTSFFKTTENCEVNKESTSSTRTNSTTNNTSDSNDNLVEPETQTKENCNVQSVTSSKQFQSQPSESIHEMLLRVDSNRISAELETQIGI